jgi:nitrogen-specific signal transduction histidine kinase
MEARVRMLRHLTMDTRSNLVLSDGLTLESLVPITRNLDDEQLEQWVINAIRNAAYRIMMEVPHLEGLPEVIIITKADFQLALTDLNA